MNVKGSGEENVYHNTRPSCRCSDYGEIFRPQEWIYKSGNMISYKIPFPR